MRNMVKKYYKFVSLSLVFLYLLFNPNINGITVSGLEHRQEIFEVNELFDVSVTQQLFYQFSLWLDWVGTHTLVRVLGGIIDGRTPTSLAIKTQLDGLESYQTFAQKHSFQQYYTFHAESEYVLEVQPPIHPKLEGVTTLHEFTVEMNFTFSVAPQGTGIIKRIIFETFTPLTLDVVETRQLIPLQEQFSWRITEWSFGSLFFSTPLFIPLAQPQNVSVQATVEFSGLTLDGWELILEQEEREVHVRDVHTLAGSLKVDPAQLCILSLSVDPPPVSEPSMVMVTIELQGGIFLSSGSSSSELNPSKALSSQTFAEVIWIFQLALVFMPLLVYYRHRRVYGKTDL
ncbi:MAG: hypothetical protein ACFFC7_27725 [Candidatus Hermodarchaeota archaeon]